MIDFFKRLFRLDTNKYFLAGFAHTSGYGAVSFSCKDAFFNYQQFKSCVLSYNPEIKNVTVVSINRLSKLEYDYWNTSAQPSEVKSE